MSNIIRQEIIAWNIAYNGERSANEPRVRNGIEFWRVGHNASHEFYAGVDAEGRMFRYSLGDEYEEGEEPAQLEGESEEDYIFRILGGDIKEIPDFNGYFGHF